MSSKKDKITAKLVHKGLKLYREQSSPMPPLAEYCEYETAAVHKAVPFDELPRQPPGTARLVCVSDTHLAHPLLQLPPGDILLHCGDWGWLGAITKELSNKDLASFRDWIVQQPFPHKVFIAGNHDAICKQLGPDGIQSFVDPTNTSVRYLQDQMISINIRGQELRIFGSPSVVKEDMEAAATAFALPSEEELASHWHQHLPAGLDIFMSHQPILEVEDGETKKYDLLNAELRKKAPRLHVCGHSHHAHGAIHLGDRISLNAAVSGKHYKLQYHPIVLDFPLRAPTNP